MCLISEIWSECSKVANMRLFNVTSIKALRLDEFELIQSHLHTQVPSHCESVDIPFILRIIKELEPEYLRDYVLTMLDNLGQHIFCLNFT